MTIPNSVAYVGSGLDLVRRGTEAGVSLSRFGRDMAIFLV